MAPDSLHPPDRRRLEAKVTCAGCGRTFGRYSFPVTASIAAGDDSVTAAVPELVEACPGCGDHVEHDVALTLE